MVPVRTKLKNNPDFKKATKAMVHKVLCELLNEDGKISDDNEEENKESEDNNDSNITLLVNSATCKNISPADIRKLLSVSKDKKDLKPSKTNKSKTPPATPVTRKVNNAIIYKGVWARIRPYFSQCTF